MTTNNLKELASRYTMLGIPCTEQELLSLLEGECYCSELSKVLDLSCQKVSYLMAKGRLIEFIAEQLNCAERQVSGINNPATRKNSGVEA